MLTLMDDYSRLEVDSSVSGLGVKMSAVDTNEERIDVSLNREQIEKLYSSLGLWMAQLPLKPYSDPFVSDAV